MADSPTTAPQPQYTVLRDDATGKPYWFKPQDVPKGLGLGLRAETDAESKDRELRSWARDNPTLAHVAGAGRMLSLGATSLIKPKTQAILAEENPVATVTGELGTGMLLPFAGELGLASKLTRALSETKAVQTAGRVLDTVAAATSAPMRAVGAAGGAVGKAIAGSSPTAARAVAAAAGRFSTEAELYNIGQNFSEANLGDEELTADRLLAHSGTALAFGAGLGAGGHVLATGALRAATAASGAVNRLRGFLDEHIPATLRKIDSAETALSAYGDTAEMLSGMPAAEARKYVDPRIPRATRERLTSPITPEEHDKLGEALYDNIVEINTTNKHQFDHVVYDKIIPKIVKDRLSERPFNAIRPDVVSTLGEAYGIIDKFKATPEVFDGPLVAGVQKKLDAFNEAFLGKPGKMNDIGEVVGHKAPNVKNAAEAFDKLIDFKRQLTDDVDRLMKKVRKSTDTTPENNTLFQILKPMRDAVNTRLQSERTFGLAAKDYALADEAYRFRKLAVGPKSEMMGQYGAAKTRGGPLELSPVKLKTGLRQTGTFGAKWRDTALGSYVDNIEQSNAIMAELAERAGVEFDKDIVDRLVKRGGALKGEAKERLRENSLLRQANNDVTGLDNVAKKAVKNAAMYGTAGMLGGLPGLAAAGAYDLLSDPVRAGKVLLTLEKLSGKVSEKTKAQVKAALGGAKAMAGAAVSASLRAGKAAAKASARGAEQRAVPLSVGAMHAFLREFPKDALPKVEGGDKSDNKRIKDFRQIEALLLDITSNPARAYDRYAKAFAPFQATAPNLTQRLVEKQLAAAQFLVPKLPGNPSYGKSLNDAINDWKPSDQDLAKFERYLRAAQDPLSVLDDMRRGALTREGVETLQALYPSLYADIQQATYAQLSELQVRLPYAQRINLSLLLGIPVDTSVTPQFVATMQGFYAGSTRNAMQGAKGGASKAGGSAIHPGKIRSFSENLRTPTQRTTAR